MTRINVVPVQELVNLHLLAEYRELPRVFAQAYNASKYETWRTRQPDTYTLGRGHVLFFYDKLLFLAQRQAQLVEELKHRGFELRFQECLIAQWRNKIPQSYWLDYQPTQAAIATNWERIHLRLKGQLWWLKELPFYL